MSSEHNLRFEFVGMLFALAIGQVAIECGDIVMKDCLRWEYRHVYSHLLLATVIIATSWVGWQTSHSYANTKLIRSSFSQQFVVLMIDIFLVICYFIIVRGAEAYYEEPGWSAPEPDGQNQTRWTMVIFVTYIIWDIITKLVIPSYEKQVSGKYIKVRRWNTKHFRSRVWPTLVCLGFSIFAYWRMKDGAISQRIVCVDFYLMGVFFLFRGLKDIKWKQDFLKEGGRISKDSLSQPTKDKMDKDLPVTIELEYTNFDYWARVILYIVLPFLAIIVSTFLYFTI